ncbi:MAG: response regulator [Methylococcaceae bacterium]
MIEILLLEDEPADAYLVRMALRESKTTANLHHVVDGREGLNFLQQIGTYANSPRPDLILLDLNMPRMNGYEFLIAVKENPALDGIPIIVLTTSEAESDVSRAYKLGASSYISKPVDMSKFVDTVRQLGEYWFTLVRLPLGHNL